LKIGAAPSELRLLVPGWPRPFAGIADWPVRVADDPLGARCNFPEPDS
jgi:hypothetical protein